MNPKSLVASVSALCSAAALSGCYVVPSIHAIPMCR